jgi:hypothetical protein
VVLILGSQQTLLFGLRRLNAAKNFEHLRTELHGAPARVGFRRIPELLAAESIEAPPNIRGRLGPVNVRPLQA